MLSDLLRWGSKRSSPTSAPGGDAPLEEPVVASRALPRFLSNLSHQSDTPVLVDLGPVVGSNVGFFGERLGCKLFIEDLFADLDRLTKANTLETLPGVLDARFRHADATVDGVLCWDLFDFLEKAAAQALATQLVRMLRPGGTVMAFFGTGAVARASFTKFEVVDEQSLRHRRHAGCGGARRVLHNRDIIRLFGGLTVTESFLLMTNTREMLLRRS